MQVPFRRSSVVVGFLLLLIALIADTWITRRQLGVQIANQARMAESRQALFDLAQLELLLNEAETGQRGFLYTGDPKYLTSYDFANSQLAPHLASLAQITVDSPVQQARLPILRNLIQVKLLELARTVVLYQSGRAGEAKSLVLSDAGLFMMNDIRTLLHDMERQQGSLEADQSAVYQKSKRVTIACIYLTNLGAAFGLMLLAYHIRQEMKAREGDARQLRKRAQEVQEREILLRTVTDYSHVGLTMFGTDRRLIYANPAYAAVLNLSTPSVKVEPMTTMMGDVDEQLIPWIDRALTGERVQFEIAVPAAPNSSDEDCSRFYAITYQPLRIDGQGPRVIGVTVDITARKQAEELLRLNVERLKLAQDVAGMASFDVEFPSGKRTWSPRAFQIFGLDSEQPQPQTEDLLRMCHPDDRSRLAEQLTLASTGKRLHFEYRIIRLDGEMRWVESIGQTIFGDAGQPLRYLGVGYDITKRKQAEEYLRRSKEQLRAFASRLQTAIEAERLRISRDLHDQLGQALTGIKMDLDWIVRKQGESGETWVSMVQSSMKVVESTISLVRRIATELRPEILDTFGLRAAIQWHSEQFQRRTGIVCIVAVPDHPLGVADEHKIAVFRIFQEALTNIARHASAKNILITLEREENAAVMTVNDDGVGFVIDPLERTQSLGILGMRERAVLVGAEFLLQSEPGHGTTLTLRIPLQDAGAVKPVAYEHIDS